MLEQSKVCEILFFMLCLGTFACSGTLEKVKSESETRRVDTIYIDRLTLTDIEIMALNGRPIVEVACRYFGSFEWDEYESEAYKIRDSIGKNPDYGDSQEVKDFHTRYETCGVLLPFPTQFIFNAERDLDTFVNYQWLMFFKEDEATVRKRCKETYSYR